MSTHRTADGTLRTVLIVVAALVLFPMLMMVVMMPMMGMMGWSWHDGVAGGISPLWGIGMMLVWPAILVGIGYLVYRSLIRPMIAGHNGDRALEELKLAYARGELSDQEYEERRQRLEMNE